MIWFIIVVALIVASPYIARWITQWITRKIQNRLREAMGIPPEPKPKHESRAERKQREEDERIRDRQRRYARQAGSPHEPLIPKEYAVDVEYTEVREYSEHTEIRPEPDGVHIVTESQVSDAEYLVIKPGENPEFPSDKKHPGFFRKSK